MSTNADTPEPIEVGPSSPAASTKPASTSRPPSPPSVVIEDVEPTGASQPSLFDALATPAPPQRMGTPNAPDPAPHAKELPSSTPASSVTPSAAPRPDVSEFDPFATPAPKPEAAACLSPNAAADNSTSTTYPRLEPVGQRSGNQATPGEPAFNFSGFLKDLRQKSAEPIAKYLKSFLANFAKKPFTVNEQIKLIRDFLRFIAEKMVLYEPWKAQSPAEFDNAMEAMEKLVMNRLYNYTFTPQLVPSQPITTDDLERDAVFAQRVRLFGWIRERHLDVPEGEASQGFLGFAEQELLKINHYKAPRDKIICILNCCKVIFGLIRHAIGPEATSADAFVPILIFVVLRANPDNMLSNIEYINRFRTASKLQGEAGYYLSSLSGAIAFIETMDASSLSNITQEEFEKNVERAIQELPPSPSTIMSRPLGPSEMSPFAAATPGEEPARPLALTTSFQALDNTRRFFQRTGNLAQEAVSKPLNAIGKILENMQQPEGSEDGSVDEMEHKWRPGGQRDHEAEARHEGGSTPRSVFRTKRPVTPESPSARFARLGISPGDESLPVSGTATPTDAPLPDFSSQLQSTIDMSNEAYARTRRANVQTLHQMFPDLDEDVVEAVLEGCGDDLGVAIDRLLEM